MFFGVGKVTIGLLAWVLSPASTGQLPVPDADPAGLAPIVKGPNGAKGLVIDKPVTWSDGRFVVEGPGSTACDLILAQGGRLQLLAAHLEVRGNVYFKMGGVLHAVDAAISLLNTWPKQFNYWWEGGHLHTTRSIIGGRKYNWGFQGTNFWLNRGLWIAKDTTIQYSNGILLGLLDDKGQGFNGDPMLKGGTLIADGLHQGQSPDAVILSGAGDAVIKNSVFSLHFYLNCDATKPIDSTLDLDIRNPIAGKVYGDMAVHDGLKRPPVTDHIEGCPWRLELQAVHVPFWFITAVNIKNQNAVPAPQPASFTLDNAEAVIISIRGTDLQGSPVLGPTSAAWSQYYPPPARLPGLPSTEPPGGHIIPPDCSVAIGNVTFKAPKAKAAKVNSWGLYLIGPGTNFAVNGAARIAEIFLWDGKFAVAGDDQYNCGLVANTINIHGQGTFSARNATIGDFSIDPMRQGMVLVKGRSVATLDQVRTHRLILATEIEDLWGPHLGIDAGKISIGHFLHDPTTPFEVKQSPGGTITVMRAGPSQNFDLTNAGFEGAVLASGAPEYWAGTGVSGYSAADASPFSAGAHSYGYKSSAATGSILKEIALCPGARVQLSGWIKAMGIPSGAWLECRVEGSGGGATSIRPALLAGNWVFFTVPLYEVKPTDGTVRIVIKHGLVSGTLDVRLDDIDIRVADWWEDGNLANLDFEEPLFRNLGIPPEFWNPPEFWKAWETRSEAETADLRPGAAPGSRSCRLTVGGPGNGIIKDFGWLVPGHRLRVRGWCKGIPAPGKPNFYVRVHVGEGYNFGNPALCNNKMVATLSGQGWKSFALDYTVPGAPCKEAFTRLAITSDGLPGAQIFLDDISVEILYP